MLTDVQHLLGEYSVGLLQVWLLPGMLTKFFAAALLTFGYPFPAGNFRRSRSDHYITS